jgi:hypothetical protein
MSGFLAYILPIGGGGPVDPGFGVPGWPSHPIAPGGPPPGPSQGPGLPTHPIAPGGPPPGIWPSPGHPAHPIAPGGPPPGPSQGPGFPTHPIAPGGLPPGIWGGGNEPFPTPPIYIGPPTEDPPEGPVNWHNAWSPQTGWIVVGVPEGPHPTPSAQGAKPA